MGEHIHDYRVAFTETADGNISLECQMTAIPRYFFGCDCGQHTWMNPYEAEKLGLVRVTRVMRRMTMAERRNCPTTIGEV